VANFDINLNDFVFELDFADNVKFLFSFPTEEEIKQILFKRFFDIDNINTCIINNVENHIYDINSFKKEYNYIMKSIQNNFTNLNDYLFYIEKFLIKNHRKDHINKVANIYEIRFENVNIGFNMSSDPNKSKDKKALNLDMKRMEDDATSFCKSNMLHVEILDDIINNNGEKIYVEMNHNNEQHYNKKSIKIFFY